ncbi:hypothetical protein AK812_SmicGene3748 [Symbiodinium microadriaticum]|uniref:Uncharacterized protein n=1 Tax=Symbiodinium microadriaticum TaxID=2951 RepID=A0A1Q9EY10_SYMMI|nr:hypothetical protein AK812_SmicGene3748 [Symbiodinium microadriaticum]
MPDAEIGFIARSEFYNNDALDYIVSSFHIVSVGFNARTRPDPISLQPGSDEGSRHDVVFEVSQAQGDLEWKYDLQALDLLCETGAGTVEYVGNRPRPSILDLLGNSTDPAVEQLWEEEPEFASALADGAMGLHYPCFLPLPSLRQQTSMNFVRMNAARLIIRYSIKDGLWTLAHTTRFTEGTSDHWTIGAWTVSALCICCQRRAVLHMYTPSGSSLQGAARTLTIKAPAMMATVTEGLGVLLANNMKIRRQVLLDADEVESLAETARYLEARETGNPEDATHLVLKNFGDWWCGQNSTKRLAVGSLEVLYDHIAKMYKLGVPLTLGERLTKQFSFFQDIEIRGSKDGTIDCQDIVGADSAFLLFLGRIMADLFPKEQLQVIVLDASGRSKQLGVEQTAVRLVWQVVSGRSARAIVVDSQKANHIVDHMINKASGSRDQNIGELLQRAHAFSPFNTWKSIFVSDVNYGNGIRRDRQRPIIRMTLNDGVDDCPMRGPQQRPLKPVFIHRFSRKNNMLDWKVEQQWPSDKGADPELSLEDYAKLVKITSIRQASGTPLTAWVAPSCKGSEPTKKIKTRTTAGSLDYGRPPCRLVPTPVKRTLAFPGDMEEFRSKIVRELGQSGNTDVDYEKGTVKWDGKDCQLVFQLASHMVHITGVESLCRQYVSVLQRGQGQGQGSTDVVGFCSTRAGTGMGPGLACAATSSRLNKPMSLAGGKGTCHG